MNTICHQYFVLSEKTVELLIEKRDEAVKEEYLEEFFDTYNKDLLKHSCWLRKRDSHWTLKHIVNANKKITYNSLTDESSIIQYISVLLKREVALSELYLFASFTTIRYTYVNHGSCKFWVDVCRFFLSNYYTVGTVEFQEDNAKILDDYCLNISASSKVIYYLNYVLSKSVFQSLPIFPKIRWCHDLVLDKYNIINKESCDPYSSYSVTDSDSGSFE